MTRAELIRKERTRNKATSYAFWILGFAIVGGVLAIPGDFWLAVLVAGYGALAIFNHAITSKCPRCRGPLNGSIAIATDHCARCGEIAVDDPRSTSN
jgi:hypothetical protein